MTPNVLCNSMDLNETMLPKITAPGVLLSAKPTPSFPGYYP